MRYLADFQPPVPLLYQWYQPQHCKIPADNHPNQVIIADTVADCKINQ